LALGAAARHFVTGRSSSFAFHVDWAALSLGGPKGQPDRDTGR
jgi:hypothetical protein